MSQFLVATWAIHPDFIPNEVGCVVHEPVEPFVEGQPPLFIRASELIHAKRDVSGFRALVRILEIHDFSPLKDSSDDGTDSVSSDSSGGDGLLGSESGGSLQPWPSLPGMRRHLDSCGPASHTTVVTCGVASRWQWHHMPILHAGWTRSLHNMEKVVALHKMANGSRLFRAQASRRWGKVTEKVTRHTVSHVYRLPPTTTGEGSTQMSGPEVKFKK
jgi:hypothetical protein